MRLVCKHGSNSIMPRSPQSDECAHLVSRTLLSQPGRRAIWYKPRWVGQAIIWCSQVLHDQMGSQQ